MIGTLEDREAIREILALYTHIIDRHRWDMMERIFHPEATFGFGPVGGDWRSFVDQARSIIEPCVSTQHMLGQTLIGFESETVAHTETYLSAMHVVPVGYTRPDVFPPRDQTYAAIVAGRYIDHFEKRGGEWKIVRRQGLYDWREFREIAAAASLDNVPEGYCGYHDDRDPSTAVIMGWRG